MCVCAFLVSLILFYLFRLKNVELLLKSVIDEQIQGDYVETGVWRGGSSAFARGVIRSNGEVRCFFPNNELFF